MVILRIVVSMVMTGSVAPPRISFPPTPGSGAELKPPPMMSLYPGLNGHISDEEKDDESEQDDALNLTVTPKKKRHKVTDTRITPRTVSRLLGEAAGGPGPNMADLHKHFGPGGPFMAPGFLPRPPFPGLPGSLPFPSIPLPLRCGIGRSQPHAVLLLGRKVESLELGASQLSQVDLLRGCDCDVCKVIQGEPCGHVQREPT